VKILFTCWPFEGHVFPQMAIATVLQEQGHEIAFYTAPSARRFIEPHGMTVFPFERVESRYWESVQDSERRSSAKGQSLRVEQQAFRNWLVETIPGQVADLNEICRDYAPDIIATDLSMWGSVLVLAETAKVPVALSSTFMGPMIPGPDAPAWGFGLAPPRDRKSRLLSAGLNRVIDVAAIGLRRRVNQIRSDNGLAPMGTSVNNYTARAPLFLVQNIRELDYERSDLPSSVNYVGPCIWHPPQSEQASDFLSTIRADRPWVHVTEGTSHHQADPFVLRSALTGLGGLPVEVIGTTGRNRQLNEMNLGSLTPNAHVTDWLSHSELLPKCKVVITTGGPATIMAALAVGVPLVIVPTTWDKPDNARRVVDAGAGVRITPRKCNPDTMRAAVDEVLSDPKYQENAQRLARSLAAAPGAPRAAELLVNLAASRRDGQLTT
jgi:MGT family glycosyltransferase